MHTRFRSLPIRRKITLILLLTSVGALVLAATGAWVYQRFLARQIIERHLLVEAEIVAANCTAAISFEDVGAAREALASFKAQPYVLCASLYLPNNTLFARFGDSELCAELPEGPLTRRILRNGDHLDVLCPVLIQEKRVGTLFLCFDMRALEQTILTPTLLILGVILVAIAAVTVAAATPLQRLISDPILQLARTARTVATAQEAMVGTEPTGGDEISTLTESFHQMLARLRDQNAALQASELHYRLLFENNPVPMLVHDEGSLAILAVNAAAVAHYGFSRA